jgi:hypothetical protein
VPLDSYNVAIGSKRADYFCERVIFEDRRRVACGTNRRSSRSIAGRPALRCLMCHALLEWRGGNMKTKTIVLTLALCFFAGAVCFASDANMGTWKLNEGKSKFAPGAAKNDTVVYTAAGDKVKITVDGTDADGKPTHNEWTGKFDGKDYAVTGDPNSDMRSYKRIDDRTLALTVKKDGKVTTTGRIVVAADGKSRTVTTSGTDAKGNKVETTAVYDKQ